MVVSKASRLYGVYEAPAANAKQRSSRAEEKKDMVTLSTQAKDYQTVKRALSDIPDVRADKINALKAKIDNGTYDVQASDVADKIFSQLDIMA